MRKNQYFTSFSLTTDYRDVRFDQGKFYMDFWYWGQKTDVILTLEFTKNYRKAR